MIKEHWLLINCDFVKFGPNTPFFPAYIHSFIDIKSLYIVVKDACRLPLASIAFDQCQESHLVDINV